MPKAKDEDEPTDDAFYGAALWIVVVLAVCAFLAWYPERWRAGLEGTSIPPATQALLDASAMLSETWMLAWPAVAMLLGATVAPVGLLRVRGRRAALVYVLATVLALPVVPLAVACMHLRL